MTSPACREHHRPVNAMPRSNRTASAQPLTCSGRVHVERGESVALDLAAKGSRSRVALVEDGAVFCASCAHELTRGGDGTA